MPCRILPDVDFRRESYLNTLAGLATCGVGELFRESGVNDKGGGRGVLHAPTIRTVAQRAGVSVGTVSRVLNGNLSVGTENRVRVEAAIRAIGYEPNVMAQGLRKRTTRTIGCVIRDIASPAFSAFVKAAEAVLRDANYVLMLASSENRKEAELRLIGMFARRGVDGLITSIGVSSDPDVLAAQRRAGVPVVLVDDTQPEWADAVLADHANGAERATEYLIRLGHRRIGFVAADLQHRPPAERLAGYRAAHRRLGVPVEESLVKLGPPDPAYSLQQTSELLSLAAPPTALLGGRLDALPGMLRAVRARRLRIPEDVSLIASADSDVAQLALPAVTAIRWDLQEAGRIAARLLLQRLEETSERPPRRVLLPTDLVLRDSCSPPV